MDDLESVSDSDLEEKELDEEKEEEEISDDVVLLTFTNVLQRAQEIAVEAEQKKFKSGQQKWKTCYKGNSDHAFSKSTTNSRAVDRNSSASGFLYRIKPLEKPWEKP